ncbi:MAG: alpha/beta hydrolase [Leptospira sp.]|nr:alpha/beta hydrolase [Leptospira sp.]
MKKYGAFLLFLFILACSSLDYRFEKNAYQASKNFEQYYQLKLQESKDKNVRPGCEEKLTRYSPGKTKYALVYIHGFGACRKEGEFIVDKVAKHYKYNTYYIRQPGHGTNKEEHRDTPYNQYLQENEIALRETQALGEKVIVIGTSMGGLISTYLAAENPDLIHAMILVSPFYEFANSKAKILEYPGGYTLALLINGPLRKSGKESTKDPVKQAMISDDYGKYWYTEQYVSAIYNIIDLKKYIARDETYVKLNLPIHLLYYEKNDDEKDPTASVAAMLEAYEHFQPNPKSKKTRIEYGAHVLMSDFVKSDKEKIEVEVLSFIDSLD